MEINQEPITPTMFNKRMQTKAKLIINQYCSKKENKKMHAIPIKKEKKRKRNPQILFHINNKCMHINKKKPSQINTMRIYMHTTMFI